MNGLNKYFDDLDKWENSFQCNECGEFDHTKFVYNVTVSNGEVWHCKNCDADILLNEKPNENNY